MTEEIKEYIDMELYQICCERLYSTPFRFVIPSNPTYERYIYHLINAYMAIVAVNLRHLRALFIQLHDKYMHSSPSYNGTYRLWIENSMIYFSTINVKELERCVRVKELTKFISVYNTMEDFYSCMRRCQLTTKSLVYTNEEIQEFAVICSRNNTDINEWNLKVNNSTGSITKCMNITNRLILLTTEGILTDIESYLNVNKYYLSLNNMIIPETYRELPVNYEIESKIASLCMIFDDKFYENFVMKFYGNRHLNDKL